MTVLKDLAVITREYTDSSGQKKKVFLTIGALVQGQQGTYISLDRHINLAGLPVRPGENRVYVMLLDPLPKKQKSE